MAVTDSAARAGVLGAAATAMAAAVPANNVRRGIAWAVMRLLLRMSTSRRYWTVHLRATLAWMNQPDSSSNHGQSQVGANRE